MSALVKGPPDAIAVYRDDGPLARAVARVLGPALPVPGALLALGALAAVIAVAAIAGAGASTPVAVVLIAWVILAGGASRGARTGARIRWAEPPLMRAAEYVTLILLASMHGAVALPAAYALLAALTFRHYDLVYRLRHRGVQPATWVSALAGGWDGRVLLASVLLAAGALPAGFYVLAGVLGAAFVGEAIYAWAISGSVEGPLEGDDEEDEL